MTDSGIQPGDRPAGKRERLVAAASRMIYQQGVEATTLADIAQAAGIPVGNVYYYFKTKNDIIEAVIDAHVRDIGVTLGAIEASHPEPRERLKALVRALAGQRDLIARYGCPEGSLCQELSKRADGPGPLSAAAGVPDGSRLMRVPVEWARRQFAAMGRADARDLAVQLIAGYEGTALLASALRDPSLLERESRRLTAMIDALLPPADRLGTTQKAHEGTGPCREKIRNSPCRSPASHSLARHSRASHCTTAQYGRRPREPTSPRSRSTCSG